MSLVLQYPPLPSHRQLFEVAAIKARTPAERLALSALLEMLEALGDLERAAHEQRLRNKVARGERMRTPRQQKRAEKRALEFGETDQGLSPAARQVLERARSAKAVLRDLPFQFSCTLPFRRRSLSLWAKEDQAIEKELIEANQAFADAVLAFINDPALTRSVREAVEEMAGAGVV